MRTRIASWLGMLSVALVAVSLLQGKWEPFAVSGVCLAASLYLTWRDKKQK